MAAESPFDQPGGELALRNLFRLLAATESGPGADFAKDVIAGTRQPREILAHGPALDEMAAHFAGYRRLLDKLPDAQRRALAEHASEELRQSVRELADLDIEASEAELRTTSTTTTPAESQSRRDGTDDDDGWFDRPIMR